MAEVDDVDVAIMDHFEHDKSVLDGRLALGEISQEAYDLVLEHIARYKTIMEWY